MTPEMVCQSESMKAGYLRLRDIHFEEMHQTAAFNLSRMLMLRKKNFWNAIRFLEREKNRTPWDKAENFIKTVDVKEGANIDLLEVTL